jgi:uncharacterized protein (DUF488 family)
MLQKAKIPENFYILTFGYGNRSNYDSLLNYFKEYEISCVIDVREKPRAWSRKWYGDQIEKLCNDHKIEYFTSSFLGNLSGTREWVSPNPVKAEQILLDIAEKYIAKTLLLLCAEIDYKRCHRTEVANQLGKLTQKKIQHLV